MKNTIILVSIICLILTFGCKQNKDKNDKNENSLTETVDNIQDSTIKDIDLENIEKEKLTGTSNRNIKKCEILEKYQIPDPSNFNFQFENSKPNFENLYSTAKLEEFQTTFSRSIAYGIYSADLIYVTCYENSNFVITYYDNILQLSNKLGIVDVYNEKELELFRETEDFDTLRHIINKNIQNTCSQLNSSKTYDELPFIIYGAWIESVYLLSNTIIDNPNIHEDFYKELASQKEVIDNLTKYLNTIILDAESFEVNNRIQSILVDLEMLKNSFKGNYKSSDYILSLNEVTKINADIKQIRLTATQKPQENHVQQQQMMQTQNNY